MRLFLLALIAIASSAFASCAATKVAERKGIPPLGSEASNIPWNDPGQGTQGGGALGGLLEGR